MEDLLRELVSRFAEYSKEYPVIAGGLGVWALGVGTYLLKMVPIRMFRFFVKHATTTLTITSSHTSYHDFLRWYEKNNYSHNSRSIKISNGRYGYEDMVKAMGYGTHYFMYGLTPVQLVLIEKESMGTDRERDQIHMTVLGRSHKVFDRIFDEIRKEKENDTETIEIMGYKDNNWYRKSIQRKRMLSSVCLNEGVQDQIINFIDSFRDREDFNLRLGINHQTAIMLYGPPGTGKTSVIKAIASHYDMPIYNMDPNALGSIDNAFAALPENAIVVIEDIDSNKALYSREAKETEGESLSEEFLGLVADTGGISRVLNTLDGVAVSHGRVLLATTNYIEKLDPALLRNGRFDLKIKIDYADNYSIKQFFKQFFPDEEFPMNYQIKDKIVPADIQSAALDNLDDPQEFLEKFRKPSGAKG